MDGAPRVHAAAQGFAEKRPVISLLALLLAVLLVGGTAVYGLAVVSTSFPTPGSIVASVSIHGDHETHVFEIGDHLPCCHETQ